MAKKTATAPSARSESGAARQPSRRELRSLRQEAAVSMAFELAKREGVAGLTMRRLAQELDLDVTALYRLFRDKDELLLAVCERTIEAILEEIGEVPEEESWQDTLRRVAEATWHVQNRFPAITVLTFARTTGGSAEQRLVELQLAAFSRAGLAPARTVLFYRAFVDAALGLCAHAAALSSLEPELRAKDDATWTRVYAQLPHGTYPATLAHIDELSGVGRKAIYDTTVEAILSAAERAARGDRHTPEGTRAE
ncbi:TetR/AcrR family transcriptional regulator [Streptomyces sp. ISL-36]|uniref:TetR/AcrR family transcriptional regulator n=1 Tax=Streptomyces sp. ISL-36 TaxID=2819182 RepID=UPI001BEA7636|nr:TetR/AcrR family transcriptional regulator [Streptomyces sp. ISL-36]MBT2439694.1 TetR/AcrR family transcriptional regulator [Streptomyces sp. ISL-36]